MIVNAENMILGRLATFIAKSALLGEKIDVVNAEKAVIIGKKKPILEKYLNKRNRGNALKGPFFPRVPELIVRRTIRGMLPYKQEKGRRAFKNIKCHRGIPKELEGKDFINVEKADITKTSHQHFMSIKSLSEHL